MTHQNDCTFAEELAEKGLDALPEMMRILINQAMQAERSKYLQAEEYERTEERKGHANGYKPKTVRTCMGEITFAVGQVRERGYYPSALEKGLRSERALTITLVEMYVQGLQVNSLNPPYYQFGKIRVINCDTFFQLYLEKATYTRGLVDDYSGSCTGADISDEMYISWIIEHMKEKGFDTSLLDEKFPAN